MAVLTTAAKFKDAYQIAATGKDTELALLATTASDWIEAETQRTFASTAYADTTAELFSPGGGDPRVNEDRDTITPRHYPIISVQSIYDDPNRDYSSAYLIPATDYRILQNKMQIKLYYNGTWVRFHSSEDGVKLSYTAGYATIPQRLETLANVVMYSMHLILDKKSKQGVSSETLGDLTVSFKPDLLPDWAQRTLAEFKRPFGL